MTPEEDALRLRMAQAMRDAGLSVGAMANEIGVSRDTVRNYLRGRSRPRRSTLIVWALRCGVSLEWLITGS